MCQPVDSVESPEGELGGGVAVQPNGEFLQTSHSRQGVDLLQAAQVGVGENQVLQEKQTNKSSTHMNSQSPSPFPRQKQ